MNFKTKRIFARELLLVILSSVIYLLAFWFGMFLDNIEKKKNEKKADEINAYDSQIDNYLLEFRKNPKVDSIYKLQINFYSDYCKLSSINKLDNGNYFFWKNVRKSIADSTFNFTYANDEIIQKFDNQHESEHNKNIQNVLYTQHYLKKSEYGIDWKLEFKLFALNNNYEKYLSPLEWKNYQEIRERRVQLGETDYLYYSVNHNKSNFTEIALTMCISILFLLRYLIYLIKWGIKIVKSKDV